MIYRDIRKVPAKIRVCGSFPRWLIEAFFQRFGSSGRCRSPISPQQEAFLKLLYKDVKGFVGRAYMLVVEDSLLLRVRPDPKPPKP